MDSLQLYEILEFQRSGGCCKARCVHCRRNHACTHRRKIAVIDVSKGADVLDKKNQSASPPLLSTHRSLGGAEAADQGGFGPRRGGKQSTAPIDIY